MQITLELLKNIGACQFSLRMFEEKCLLRTTNLSDVFKYLDNECKDSWTNWLFRNLPGNINENLAEFKNCKNLTTLDLSNTQISDAGLAHFKNCKNLTTLNLYNTQISDAGLAHFKDCKNLAYLNLTNTEISDIGLTNFVECKNLTHFTLCGTKVSKIGLSRFRKNLQE